MRRKHHPPDAPEAEPDLAAPRPDVEAPAETEPEPAAPDETEAKEEPMAGADDSQVSVVSRGTKIEGSVMAAGSLRVEG
ncbi:MAG TPA: hypothetical protein VLX89_04100, partial [Actinomycetota bacterium]|nr:hypothetical protein [Actinomycetota bacterium]